MDQLPIYQWCEVITRSRKKTVHYLSAPPKNDKGGFTYSYTKERFILTKDDKPAPPLETLTSRTEYMLDKNGELRGILRQSYDAVHDKLHAPPPVEYKRKCPPEIEQELKRIVRLYRQRKAIAEKEAGRKL